MRCVIHACMRIAFVPVLAVIYMLYVNLNNRVTANASVYIYMGEIIHPEIIHVLPEIIHVGSSWIGIIHP